MYYYLSLFVVRPFFSEELSCIIILKEINSKVTSFFTKVNKRNSLLSGWFMLSLPIITVLMDHTDYVPLLEEKAVMKFLDIRDWEIIIWTAIKILLFSIWYQKFETYAYLHEGVSLYLVLHRSSIAITGLHICGNWDALKVLQLYFCFRLLYVKDGERKIPLYSIHMNPLNNNEFCVSGRDNYIRIYDKRKVSDNTQLKRFCPKHLVSFLHE